MPDQGIAHRRHADLIANIYDAALDPEAWRGLAGRLCGAMGGETSVAFISHHDAVTDFLLHNIAGEAVARYGAYYHSVDPLLAMSKRNAATRTESVFSYMLMPDREFAETEFYRDFGRQAATFHMLGCGLPIDAERTFAITVQRPADGRRFELDEKRRFDRLLPHLQRALQLKDRLAGDRLDGIGLAALDALAFGAVVCDAEGRVRFANAAAEKLARGGTGLDLHNAGGGISALRPKESRELAALVADAAHGGAGGGLKITSEAGEVLLALVAPLPRRIYDQPWLALVTLRPATASPTVSGKMLARLFGLTAAEAGLALALFAGDSLAEIGVERRVTNNTLRTQLASVLRKTDTPNQRGLVRLLGLLPPLR